MYAGFRKSRLSRLLRRSPTSFYWLRMPEIDRFRGSSRKLIRQVERSFHLLELGTSVFPEQSGTSHAVWPRPIGVACNLDGSPRRIEHRAPCFQLLDHLPDGRVSLNERATRIIIYITTCVHRLSCVREPGRQYLYLFHKIKLTTTLKRI